MDESGSRGGEGKPTTFELGILPLRNSVLFPGVIIPLAVGRPKSIRLLEEMVAADRPIAVVAQHKAEVDDPTEEQLFQVGTMARIVKVIKLSRDNYSVIVQGLSRVRILHWQHLEPYHKATFVEIPQEAGRDVELEALFINLRTTAKEVMKLMPEVPNEASNMLETVNEPGQLTDLIASNLEISTAEKQEILEMANVKLRLKRVLGLVSRQLEVLKVSDKIHSQVKEEIDKSQREFYLRQQMKAIKEELGDTDGEATDHDDLLRKLEEADLPEEVEKSARKQFKRLKLMQPASSEYMVTRTYFETLIELPWRVSTKDNLDIEKVETILNEDHYDLEKVKKRIVEYLAVRKLKEDMKGPILCLVGPPGVGKTSLGKSIARAMDRKFFRMSLGGIHDEAEIRGHRRTYVGSLPGRIVAGIKKAGVNNPVFMLDEIDKLGKDFRGDPASALLEVLDPEQNHAFSDHYLELPFDLSKVMFICTANMLDPIPDPLRDRMEILELPGYTRTEKLHIARKFLIPKQLSEHGLSEELLTISDEVVFELIDSYTREAGVRNLERSIAAICRGVAVDVAKDKKEPRTVRKEDIDSFLGAQKFFPEAQLRTRVAGVATGLAWTAAGGDLLFLEATRMPGKGNLVLTGKLGEVMKESAHAALSYVRTYAEPLGIDPGFLREHDIHVHVPAGAIPKDGPSAGVAIFTALLSLLRGVRVRGDVAMTGEITLRGSVLPVGGIKEKVLAAHRAELARVVMPERNRKDLEEIPEEIRKDLEFVFIETVEDILPHVLEAEAAASDGSGAAPMRAGDLGGAAPARPPAETPSEPALGGQSADPDQEEDAEPPLQVR